MVLTAMKAEDDIGLHQQPTLPQCVQGGQLLASSDGNKTPVCRERRPTTCRLPATGTCRGGTRGLTGTLATTQEPTRLPRDLLRWHPELAGTIAANPSAAQPRVPHNPECRTTPRTYPGLASSLAVGGHGTIGGAVTDHGVIRSSLLKDNDLPFDGTR